MHQRTYDRLVDRMITAEAEAEDHAEALLARFVKLEGGEPPRQKRSFWS